MNFKSILLIFTIFFILFMFLIPLAFQNKIKECLEIGTGSPNIKFRCKLPNNLIQGVMKTKKLIPGKTITEGPSDSKTADKSPSGSSPSGSSDDGNKFNFYFLEDQK